MHRLFMELSLFCSEWISLLKQYNFIMSFFTKGDFKTREQWLKRQKKATLKRQEQKYNKSIKDNHQSLPQQQPKKEKLNQIITLDTQQSFCSQKPTPKQEINLNTFKSESDAALFWSMQVRLQEQQQLRQKQRSKIAELNRSIQQAKTENTILKAVNQEMPSFQQAENILTANKQLSKKYSEMQAYLNSHGAFYEGSTIVGEFNVDKIKKDIKESKTNYRTPSIFEFTAIEQRVQQLNQNLLKQMGSKKIVNAQGINKFKECDKMKVIFFKDGVKFQEVGFYEYSSKDGLKILGDLTDGYYPHILKKAFPDGVYMNLENKIGEAWKECESPPKDWFFGKGHSLDHD